VQANRQASSTVLVSGHGQRQATKGRVTWQLIRWHIDTLTRTLISTHICTHTHTFTLTLALTPTLTLTLTLTVITRGETTQFDARLGGSGYNERSGHVGRP